MAPSSLVLEASDELPFAAAHLIDRASWGTAGLRYQTLDGSEHCRSLPDQRYFILKDGATVRGVYAVARHELEVNGRRWPAGYRNTLVIDSEVGGRGWGRQLAEHARTELAPGRALYGYIEAKNHRSVRVAERLGYVPRWRLRASLVGFRKPRPSAAVIELSRDVFAPLVQAATQEHVRPSIEVLLRGGRMFGYVVNGEIKAALATTRRTWQVHTLGPSIGAKAIFWTVPRLRLLGQTLVGGAFQHLRVSTVVVADGAEQEAARLIEAVIAEHGVNMAIWLVDPRESAYVRMRSAGTFGWLDAAAGGDEVVVYAGGALADDQWAGWSQRPLAVPVAFPG